MRGDSTGTDTRSGVGKVGSFIESLILRIRMVHDYSISRLSDKIYYWTGTEIAPRYINLLEFLSITGLIVGGILPRILKIGKLRREVLRSERKFHSKVLNLKISLPGEMSSAYYNGFRFIGKIQCIGVLRNLDPETGIESYNFLGNDFILMNRSDSSVMYPNNNSVVCKKGVSIETDFYELQNPNNRYIRIRVTEVHMDYIISYILRELNYDDFNLNAELPSVIISIIHKYYLILIDDKFGELDPNTEVVSVPEIDHWDHDTLESLFVFGGFMNDPKLGDIMRDLNEEDKEDIFESIRSSYKDRRSTNDLDYMNDPDYYGMMRYSFPSFIDKLLTKLNKKDDIVRRREIGEALLSKEEREKEKSYHDGIKDIHRISKDTYLIRYLPAPIRNRIGKEMLAYSLLLNNILVFPENQLLADRGMILESIFSTFGNKILFLINDRSIDDKEGFICRHDSMSKNLGIHRDGEIYRDYFSKGIPRNDMVKSSINQDRTYNLEKMIRFMVTGTRIYDWMDMYRSLPIVNYSIMNINTLYETVSFWGFKVTEYLGNENQTYSLFLTSTIVNLPKISGDRSIVGNYLNSIMEVMLISRNDGLHFCLRYLDDDTVGKIIDSTDPDIGTHIRSEKSFIVLHKIKIVNEILAKRSEKSRARELLIRWADHCLPRLRGHSSMISFILEKNKDGYDPKNVRLNLFDTIDRRSSLSHELKLYCRIYASLILRKNLIQQAVQMTLYSGLTLAKPGHSSDTKNSHDSKIVNNANLIQRISFFTDDMILRQGEKKESYYHNVREKQEYFCSDRSIEYDDISASIERLFENQGQLIKHHGIGAFTYSGLKPNDTKSPNGTDYDLSRLTLNEDITDWSDCNLLEEFKLLQ